MKRFRATILLFLMYGIGETALAQSMYWAKQYYEQGKYMEAAKQLRPLADGGDAEAQYLAATLFFEGKGVKQSNEQGIKYLRMSVEQGNDDARLLYAECLFTGKGTAKDYDKGWQMISGHAQEESFKEKHGGEYWPYKMQKEGKTSLEDLADQLYAIRQTKEYDLLTSYIEINEYAQSAQRLKVRADMGNAWAMGRLAQFYFEKEYKKEAIEWAKKSADAGSAYGQRILEELEWVPITCTRLSIGQQKDQRFSIESVVLGYDRITVNFVFHNNFSDWIANSPEKYIRYGGKSYKLLHSTLPIFPKRRTVAHNEVLKYSDTYYLEPHTIPYFDIIEDRTVLFSNVRILNDIDTKK